MAPGSSTHRSRQPRNEILLQRTIRPGVLCRTLRRLSRHRIRRPCRSTRSHHRPCRHSAPVGPTSARAASLEDPLLAMARRYYGSGETCKAGGRLAISPPARNRPSSYLGSAATGYLGRRPRVANNLSRRKSRISLDPWPRSRGEMAWNNHRISSRLQTRPSADSGSFCKPTAQRTRNPLVCER